MGSKVPCRREGTPKTDGIGDEVLITDGLYPNAKGYLRLSGARVDSLIGRNEINLWPEWKEVCDVAYKKTF